MAGWDGEKFLRGRVRGDARTARRGSAAQVPSPAVRIFFLFSSIRSVSCFLKEKKKEKSEKKQQLWALGRAAVGDGRARFGSLGGTGRGCASFVCHDPGRKTFSRLHNDVLTNGAAAGRGKHR